MTIEQALEQLNLGPGINEDVSEEYNEATDMAIAALERELMTELWPPVPRVANYGGIQDLIKQLQDLVLIYGDNKIVLTITDGESEYRIKDITGQLCAQYFEPSDHVSEAIMRISRK